MLQNSSTIIFNSIIFQGVIPRTSVKSGKGQKVEGGEVERRGEGLHHCYWGWTPYINGAQKLIKMSN